MGGHPHEPDWQVDHEQTPRHPRSYDRFQVGSDNSFHPTVFRLHEEIFDSSTTPLPPASQGFERNLQSNFVTVLETVGHSLCRTVDFHSNAFNGVHIKSFAKGISREPHNPHLWMSNPRLSGPVLDGYPHLVRRLCCDLMEAEGGEQAYYAFGNGFGCLGKTVVDCRLGVRQHVQTPAYLHNLSLITKPAQILRMNAEGRHLSGTHYPGVLRKL